MVRIDRQTSAVYDQLELSFPHEGQVFHIHPTPIGGENPHANVSFVVVDGNNDHHGKIEGLLGIEDQQLVFKSNFAVNAFNNVWADNNPKHVRRVIAIATGHLAMRMKRWEADSELLPKGREMYEYLKEQSLDPTSPLYEKITVTPITRVLGGRRMNTFQITPTRCMS